MKDVMTATERKTAMLWNLGHRIVFELTGAATNAKIERVVLLIKRWKKGVK
jgi:hypothetical protein